MRSFLLPILTLCASLASPASSSPITEQQPLARVEGMAEREGPIKVPGHNSATYGPVPKGDQLFQVEFLEIAPSPIPVYDPTPSYPLPEAYSPLFGLNLLVVGTKL